jgi:hypothetical protein
MSTMDWTKHAKQATKRKDPTGPRRMAVTVTVELQKLIDHFIANFPQQEFNTTAVLNTLIEAGAREYINTYVVKRQSTTSVNTLVSEDE